jgi:hypothetical protein
MTAPAISALTVKPTLEMLAAEERYRCDLPELLRTKFGRWVVYTDQGRIAEGDDELALFQECFRRGLERGHFLVARAEPDAPTAQITENWSPLLPCPGTHDAALPEGS